MSKQNVDVGRPDKRPSFYKIMWFANVIDLKIPNDFKHHLVSNGKNKRAILKTALGNHVVKIQHIKGDLYFVKKGWQDFLKLHSLGHAEFVVFKYNADTSFDVVVYETNGCPRNYPPPAHPQPSSSRFTTSSFPFFTRLITSHNIGRSSKVDIPREFQEKHLPLSRQEITLQDSEGVSWPVTVTKGCNNYLIIVGGWKAFADSHSIKIGDDCVFELLEQNMMKVHISRHSLINDHEM